MRRNHVKPHKAKDEFFTIFGSVVQKAFENFYNQEMWRKGSQARQLLLDSVPGIFNNIVKTKVVYWGDHDDTGGREGLLQKCLDSVNKNIDVIKQQGLIGQYARSEVNIYTFVDDKNQIMGRLDFLIKKDEKVKILDGKGSKSNKGKKEYQDQLYWYALLYFLRYRKLPDELWLWFYLHPEDPLLRVDFNVSNLKELKDNIVTTMKDIYKNKFAATPSSASCHFCLYSGECKFESNHKNKPLVKEPGVQSIDLDD